MRLSCSVPTDKASDGFITKVAQCGITPIVTSQVIRAVYEGKNEKLCDGIIALYEAEPEHQITVFRDKAKKPKKGKRG